MKFLLIVLFFTLLVPFSIAEFNVIDYCVSNLKLPKTPAGYPCIDPDKLTSDDFVFTGFHNPVNIGDCPALAFVSLNSANPGIQFVSSALGANDLPTEIISKITLLDEQQIRRLKLIFGGTNQVII
ncbi:unnamed protein product [Amaranthus hypochondriacus]